MKKLFSFMSLVVVLFLFSFSQGTSANELNVEFSPSDISKLKENFSQLGINKETQESLIKKLENGETLDSMKSENLGKIVNKLDHSDGKLNLNKSETITFEDGSKIVYGNELIDTDIGILSKNPGLYTVRSYWHTGVLNYSFYSDFTIVSGANNDYIRESYNPAISVVVPGGTFSNVELEIKREKETSTRRAYSALSFIYSVPLGGSATAHLYFNLGDNDWETTLSLADRK